MVAYGDTDTIAQMLEPSTSDGFSAALTARIDAMQEVVSRLLDAELGRSFGVAAVAELRGVIGRGCNPTGVLVLPTPARTILSVTTGMTDAGGVLSGGSLLDTSEWAVQTRDREQNIVAIRFGSVWLSGDAWGYPAWWGLVGINAFWADAGATTDVPADVTWLVNYVTARTIQEENTSVTGTIGEDGTAIFPRNPWSHPQVKKTISRHKVITKELIL